MAQQTLLWGSFESNWGPVMVGVCEGKIASISFRETAHGKTSNLAESFGEKWARLAESPDEVRPFFEGAFCQNYQTALAQPVWLRGTSFQLRVWKALRQIPFGETMTYGQLAAEIGSPKAARAVGSAIGANKIAYLVPCHRVVPADGSIGQFRWGSELKSAILESERRL